MNREQNSQQHIFGDKHNLKIESQSLFYECSGYVGKIVPWVEGWPQAQWRTKCTLHIYLVSLLIRSYYTMLYLITIDVIFLK